MGKSKSKRSVLIYIILVILIISCKRTDTTEKSVIEIGERMFLTQIQDIRFNSNDFLGRTIRLEGIFTGISWNEAFYYYVVRYASDGCCGGDNVGFEVMWPKNLIEQYPDNNSWVEATGVLKLLKDDIYRNLYLELVSLNVLDKRGAEFVWR